MDHDCFRPIRLPVNARAVAQFAEYVTEMLCDELDELFEDVEFWRHVAGLVATSDLAASEPLPELGDWRMESARSLSQSQAVLHNARTRIRKSVALTVSFASARASSIHTLPARCQHPQRTVDSRRALTLT